MALMHTNPALAWTPSLYTVEGSFVDVTSATATANRQIRPAYLSVTAGGNGQAVGADKQIAPISALMKVFARPNGAAATASGSDNLPRGVITGTPDQGLYLLDLSGHPGDILSADASLITHSTTLPIPRDVVVSGIDNVNKLVYLQVIAYTTGNTAAAAVGDQICFKVVMKDSSAA